jgi:hypothetical protein
LGDKRLPAGGVSDGATGIGASALAGGPDFALEALDALDAAVSLLALVASCEGCGALPSAPGAAPAELGSAHAVMHAKQHARTVDERATTRA